MTLKCQAFIHLAVQFLTTLDQSGNISIASLESEMEKLLECVMVFNPPGETVFQTQGNQLPKNNEGSGLIWSTAYCPSLFVHVTLLMLHNKYLESPSAVVHPCLSHK